MEKNMKLNQLSNPEEKGMDVNSNILYTGKDILMLITHGLMEEISTPQNYFKNSIPDMAGWTNV